MPSIFEYLGIILYFYSNEHEPIHVHGRIGDFLKKSMHPIIRSYLKEEKFKKFYIDSGNIVWGKNWDLVFPIEQLYKGKI